MNGYPPRKPKSARRVAFPKWAFVGAIAGAALISACSQPSDSQQTAARQQAEPTSGIDADLTIRIQSVGSVTHQPVGVSGRPLER